MILPHLLLAAALAAPPPPPVLPKRFPATLQGYDVASLYGAWSYAVPRAKGEITREALAEPPKVAGYQPRGRLLQMEGVDYDLGPDAASDIHRLCPADKPEERSGCITVLRWAVIPHTAWGDGPLNQWLQRNFDPAKLVRLLKARGIAPSDVYGLQARLAFQAMADPRPELKRLLEVRQIDSRTCSALAQATEQLEGRKVELSLDLQATGTTDTYPAPINPHAYRWEYRWSFVNDGWAGLSGTGATSLAGQLAQPFTAAAEACGINSPEARVSAG